MEELDASLDLMQIFLPRAVSAVDRIKREKLRLVHYTSAEVALSIIRHKKFWMRKTSTMNDFMEVEHGAQCIEAALRSSAGVRLKAALNEISTSIFQRADDEFFNGWQPAFRYGTYLACVSEHLPSEDKIGRLSMWRAYGGNAGVALVLKNDAFVSESDVLKIYTSPVEYLDKDGYEELLAEVASNVEKNLNHLKSIDPDDIYSHLFHMLRFSMLSSKHPGFLEEKEWRVIYTPDYDRSEVVALDVEVVKGIPQLVAKVPLNDRPEEGLVGMSLEHIIERIIIGPCDTPHVIYEALVSEMQAAGIPNSQEKVVISSIPLR